MNVSIWKLSAVFNVRSLCRAPVKQQLRPSTWIKRWEMSQSSKLFTVHSNGNVLETLEDVSGSDILLLGII